jgi:hypothetical protein
MTEFAKDGQAATNISPEHMRDFKAVNVATRMSWMAKRKTSKIENVALCNARDLRCWTHSTVWCTDA